jgi:hypothetical protein
MRQANERRKNRKIRIKSERYSGKSRKIRNSEKVLDLELTSNDRLYSKYKKYGGFGKEPGAEDQEHALCS